MPSVYDGLVRRPRSRMAARDALPRERAGQSVNVNVNVDVKAQAEQGVNNVYSGQTATGETIDIGSYLKQFCAQGTTCNAAAKTASDALDKLGPTAQTAAQLMSTSSTAAGALQAAPIVAGALGAMIGGPAGAAIAGTVAAGVENVFESLFGQQMPAPPKVAQCAYTLLAPGIGGVCFQNLERPPGPVDPITKQPDSRWISIETFIKGPPAGPQKATWLIVNGSLEYFGSGALDTSNPHDSWPNQAFPMFWSQVGVPAGPAATMPSYSAAWNASLFGSLSLAGVKVGNLKPISPTGPASYATVFNQPHSLVSPEGMRAMLANFSNFNAAEATANIAGFISVYCQAFLRGVCERMINNWPIDPTFPMILLSATVQAWNAAHEDSVQYTFAPDNSVTSFVDAVVRGYLVVLPGQTQGYGGWDQTINVGPKKPASVLVPVMTHPTSKPGLKMSPGVSSVALHGETPAAFITDLNAIKVDEIRSKAATELIGVGAFSAVLAAVGGILAKLGILVFL